MAKAIIRFGIKGGKHASRLLSVHHAAKMAGAMDFVHGGKETDQPQDATAWFTVSKKKPRVSLENSNTGFWVEVEYVPPIAAKIDTNACSSATKGAAL